MSISIDTAVQEWTAMKEENRQLLIENSRLSNDLEDTKAQLRRTETPEYTVQVRKLEAENKRLLSDLCVERNQRKNAETFLGLAQKAIIGKNETIKMLSAERNKLSEDLANAQAQLRAKDQHQDRLLDPGYHVIRVRVGDQMVNVREVMEEVKTLREAVKKMASYNGTTLVSYNGQVTTIADLINDLEAMKSKLVDMTNELKIAHAAWQPHAVRANELESALVNARTTAKRQLANATKRAVRQQQYIDRLRLAITELQRVVIAGLPHSKYPKNPV